jgi:WD40 repeat protein
MRVGKSENWPAAEGHENIQSRVRPKRRKRSHAKGVSRSVQSWKIREVCGGKFSAKSVFSNDEKYLCNVCFSDFPRYLFVGTVHSIKVFSVSSGKFLRSIASNPKHRILDFILDPSNEYRLIVSATDSSLAIFDWTDGQIISVCNPITLGLKCIR